MTKDILILLAFLFLGFSNQLLAQCVVEATALPGNVVCGDCTSLEAFGEGQGQKVFDENFNSGTASGWNFTQQATWNNPCSPGGVDGTTHIWMGNNSPVPRILRTNPYNVTSATAGVTICFDMLFATQGNNAPCEGPDEPDEGVYLQYSIDGGNTWNTIHYFDPNGGNDPTLVNWNNWCFPLPPAAVSSQTQIRWFQDNDSGADYDHWGVDNVNIYYNDPTYEIVWQHDGYSYGVGNSGGINPNPVCPRVATNYVVVMSNGNFSCRDSVTITVDDPMVSVDAGTDTTVCLGDCAQLDGTAKVIKRTRQIRTYSNNELTAITTGLAGATSPININVTGLNMTNVLPGSITKVCITSLNYFGFGFPNLETIANLEINLLCPDGTSITLIPSGLTTSMNPSPLDGYTNTCFTPNATANIQNSTPNYTGNFVPDEPLDNLAGCTANGVWSMEVVNTSSALFGAGTFFGWSITFDDPEISYEADFVWSPDSSLSDANVLDPTACPTSSTPYTLTASDTAGCVTVTDDVTVFVDSVCCDLKFTPVVSQPSCIFADGAVNIQVTSGSGNYSYAWSNGASTQNVANLPVGPISVTVTDIIQNCSKDTLLDLSAPGAPKIDSIVVSHEICFGDSNGTVQVYASGGTGTLNYIWSTGANGSGIISLDSLAGGNYSVTVEDANACFDFENFTINPGPVCCKVEFTIDTISPTCGGNDGAINLTFTLGSGNYNFIWSDTTLSSEDRLNLAPGTYFVTVEDLTQLCSVDTAITLSSTNAPVIDSFQVVDETCPRDSNGTATVFASEGTGTLSYSWSHIAVGANVTGLTAGNYTVTVTDDLNCQTVGTISIGTIGGQGCCNISVNVDSTDISCFGETDGSASAIASGGTGTLSYLWNNTLTSTTIDSLAPGTYSVTVTDSLSCKAVDSTQVNDQLPLSIPLNPNISQCADSIILDAGNNFATYLWSTGDSSSTTLATQSGTFGVTVYDNNNCQATASTTVTLFPTPDVFAGMDTTIDQFQSASLIAQVSGTVNVNGFEWTPIDYLSCTTCQNPVTSPDEEITYTVTYNDLNGCLASDEITIFVNEVKYYAIVPSAFSPNGDEINDRLNVVTQNVNEFNLLIFNRWGEKVYETSNTSFGWDGYIGDEPAGIGTYAYLLQWFAPTGKMFEESGTITLIR